MVESLNMQPIGRQQQEAANRQQQQQLQLQQLEQQQIQPHQHQQQQQMNLDFFTELLDSQNLEIRSSTSSLPTYSDIIRMDNLKKAKSDRRLVLR